MKTLKISIICIFCALLIQAILLPQVFAGGSSMEQRILKIETALGLNANSGISIEERVAAIEKEMAKPEETADLKAQGGPMGEISEWVTLSGGIEVEMGFESSDVNNANNSDVSLATAELGIEASPQDWLTGFMLIKWEDEDDKMIVDEAHITLGSTDEIPYYLSAGKIYVPFGLFETMMISDPITLDIAETVDNTIQVGFEMKGIRSAVYAFNGEAEEAVDKDDTIDVFGVSLGYAKENDEFSFDFGVDWVNNILESGGFRDVYNNNGWAATLDDQVPGFAIHAMATFGPVCLIGEYIAMTDDVKAVGGARILEEISAYSLEAGYTFEMSGFETTLAIGYQASDYAADILPESKFLTSIGVGLTDNLSLALEYSKAENNSVVDSGDGDKFDTITTQLAFEF